MAKDNSKGTVVRRVKATGSKSSAARTDEKKVAKKPAAKSKAAKTKKTEKSTKKSFILFRPIFAIGRYFRDSWRELRQVRWTNRRATWALTLAVLLFCLFFILFIMLFDWIFNWTVQEVIL